MSELQQADSVVWHGPVVTTTRRAKDTGRNQLLPGTDQTCPMFLVVCLLSGSVNEWSVE
ncbi:hypothetical protein ABVT39_020532 [Epinephelus coioides]